MRITDFIFGPKCADCGNRIKVEKFALQSNQWLCRPCKTTRDNAQERRDDLSRQLLTATADGDVSAVSAALAKGADVNATASVRDSKGTLWFNGNSKTALYSACHRRNPELVQLLLAANADVNAKMSDDGETALIMACQRCESSGDPAIVADITLRGLAIVKLLLAANANINAKDRFDNSVLYYAQEPELMELLVKAGASGVPRFANTSDFCKPKQETPLSKYLLGGGGGVLFQALLRSRWASSFSSEQEGRLVDG